MKFARHLLEYLAARALLALLALLPRPLATRVAMGASPALFACLPRLRRIGLRNLELAFPNLSLAERRQLLDQSLENFGRIIADFAHFPYTTPASSTRVEPPPEALKPRPCPKAAGPASLRHANLALGNYSRSLCRPF